VPGRQLVSLWWISLSSKLEFSDSIVLASPLSPLTCSWWNHRSHKSSEGCNYAFYFSKNTQWASYVRWTEAKKSYVGDWKGWHKQEAKWAL
jgi:hypothetical protein